MSNDGSILPQSETEAPVEQAAGQDVMPVTTLEPAVVAEPAEPTAAAEPPEQAANTATPDPEPVPTDEPAAPVPKEAQAPAHTNKALETPQALMADLAERMTKVETGIQELGAKERELQDLDGAVAELSQRLEAALQNLGKANGRISKVSRGLDNTPNYDVRNDFTCECCGSRRFVAIAMKCTSCGGEGWWGWWPEEN